MTEVRFKAGDELRGPGGNLIATFKEDYLAFPGADIPTLDQIDLVDGKTVIDGNDALQIIVALENAVGK